MVEFWRSLTAAEKAGALGWLLFAAWAPAGWLA